MNIKQDTIHNFVDTTTVRKTDTIHKPDTIYMLQPEPEIDSTIICSPTRVFFSSNFIKENNNLLGYLTFTVIFLIVFSFVRLRGKDLLNNLLHTLVSRKKAEVIVNEGISSNLVCYFLALLLSFSMIGCSIIYLGMYNFIFRYIFYMVLALFVYHYLLILLIKFLGWTFNAKYIASEVIVNLWTYHIMSGLMIAPFVIATFFVGTFTVDPLVKIIIFGLILFYIIKFIRWVEILFAYRVSILYMILYLCTLEVIPLLILYKLVV